MVIVVDRLNTFLAAPSEDKEGAAGVGVDAKPPPAGVAEEAPPLAKVAVAGWLGAATVVVVSNP